MAKSTKTKSVTKRVKIGKLSVKTKLTGKSMKKVKGGFIGGVWVAVGDVNGDRVAGFISGKVGKGH
jgi:hypothetical protein